MTEVNIAAFPMPNTQSEGMSLRDYFAGQAIAPFMSWAFDQEIYPDYDTAQKAAAKYAKAAYLIADALLEARSND